MRHKTSLRVLAVLLILILALPLAGLAYALHSGTLSNADAQLIGNSTNQRLSYAGAVGSAGDVNGDGYDDVLIGAPYDSTAGPNAGAAFLLLGRAGGWGMGTSVAHPSVISYTGEAGGDYAGTSVAGAGDVNGDGYDDMLIGADGNNDAGPDAGAAYLVLGATTLYGGSLAGGGGDTILEYTGEAQTNYAGVAVAGAGDVNGDSYDDMLIGADGFNPAGGYPGAAYLVLGDASPNGGSLAGGAGDTIRRYTGEGSGDYAGGAVAGAGDVNGDGYHDMLVGAPYVGSKDNGAAYLILGAAALNGGSLGGGGGDTIRRYDGEGSYNFAGGALDGGGDVNGDGFDDMVIGADGNSDGGGLTGSAYLVLGAPSLNGGSLNGSGGDAIYQYNGEASSDYAGFSVSGAGDVNGDGYADFLVGADYNDAGGPEAGAAYLVMGRETPNGGSLAGTGGNIIYRFAGEAGGDHAGSGVEGAGDVNGDGYADLLIGSDFNDDGAADAGAAYLLFSDSLVHANSPIVERHRLFGNSGDARPVVFEQAGVTVDFTAGAVSGGEITVARHVFHPCKTNIRLKMPIWSINTNKVDVDSGSSLELWFEYTDDQVAGMVEENLAVWQRSEGGHCVDWVQSTGTVTRYPATNQVRLTVTGVTGLSQFTLADVEPDPTAVEMGTMGAYLAQEPIWLVALMAMLVLTSGATYWYVRTREEKAILAEQRVDITDIIADKVAARLRHRPEE
jgi:hypothetical protein